MEQAFRVIVDGNSLVLCVYFLQKEKERAKRKRKRDMEQQQAQVKRQAHSEGLPAQENAQGEGFCF